MPAPSVSKCRQIQCLLAVEKSNGINLHTVRHKSVLYNISQSQSHHPTQNAMPQASIRPEADYLKKKKSAVQYTVG